MAQTSVNDELVPPYLEAEEMDLNVEADLDTAATLLSIVTSLVIIGAYLEFKDG